MTASTGHISTPTNYDVAFGRGVLMGVLATIVLAAALVAAIWLAGQFPIPAQGPSSLERPAPVQVDENSPVVRPGGVKVY